MGVARRGERAAGPGSWIGGFAGDGEGEEMSEAGVAEGVGVDEEVGAWEGVEAGGADWWRRVCDGCLEWHRWSWYSG